jgi:hypothetical protein
MPLTSPERRKLMDEHPTSWRSHSVRVFCEQRSEAYYRALETGSKSDLIKYEELTKKFVRLHGLKKRG